MDFNFDNAEIETGSQYLSPGNYVVTVNEVKSGTSTKKGSPYIEIVVADNTMKTASQQYYLNTDIKEGSTKSAWDISKNAILQIVAAALNMDADTAKTKMPRATGAEDLATKLSALLAGKTFAIKLNGEWINPEGKNSWLKAKFGTGKFAVPTDKITELRAFDKTKDVKGTNLTSTTPTNGAVVDTTKGW